MSKGYLEAKTEDFSKLLYEVYDVPSGICECINKDLLELKSIKESNPSEALIDLEKIKIGFGCDMAYYNLNVEYENVKQTLLKAKEQEKEIDRLDNQCLDLISDNIRLKKKLDTIKEKCLTNCNLALVEDNVHYENYCKEFEYFLNKYNESPNGFEITKEDLLTQEEFDTLKRWLDE